MQNSKGVLPVIIICLMAFQTSVRGANPTLAGMSAGIATDRVFDFGGADSDVRFSAPVLTVDPAHRVRHDDAVYITASRAGLPGSPGQGNLKKYKLRYGRRMECNHSGKAWFLADQTGRSATDCSGAFKRESISCWQGLQDGGRVDCGGVGAVLKDRMPGRHPVHVPQTGPYYNFRHIHMYKNGALARFYRDGDAMKANDTVTPADLDVGEPPFQAADYRERDRIINYVYGYTFDAVCTDSAVYDPRSEGDPVAKRSWILGDMMQSRPCIIDYFNEKGDLVRRYIAIGSNDGMLHVFTDRALMLGGVDYPAGAEIWAFIPGDMLKNLKKLKKTGKRSYFVDGAAILCRGRQPSRRVGKAIRWSEKILVFGERRGGRSYWALNVTDPEPQHWTVQWQLGPAALPELGYTWSAPVPASIMTTEGRRGLLVFGGGYDPEADSSHEPFENSIGRGIFIVAPKSGRVLFQATYGLRDVHGDCQAFPEMQWCFPAEPTVVTTHTGLLIYAADIRGQIWKIIYKPAAKSGKWRVRRIFAANETVNTGRKMFFSPDVWMGGISGQRNPVLFFGTGDLAHPYVIPRDADRFYCLIDTGGFATESHLRDMTHAGPASDPVDNPPVTSSLVQEQDWRKVFFPAVTQGWYRVIGNGNAHDGVDRRGERVACRPSLFNGIVYFTTYQPEWGSGRFGKTRVYALRYFDGSEAGAFMPIRGGTARLDVNSSKSKNHPFFISYGGVPSEIRFVFRANAASAFFSTGSHVIRVGNPAQDRSAAPGEQGIFRRLLWEHCEMH